MTEPQMTQPQNATTMIRVLGALARKGACLEPVEGGFGLVTPGMGRRVPGATPRVFTADIVEAAIRQGWINRDGQRCRLTEAGALTLHSGLRPELTRPVDRVDPLQNAVHPKGSNPRLGPDPTRLQAPRRPAQTPTHQMDAAEKLAEDFQTGQMAPRVTSNWERAALGALPGGSSNPSGRGVEVSERISAAQERVRRALTDAGPEFADVLIDLCCFETGIEAFEIKRGWPRRSAKLVLGLALDRLARHYGMVRPEPRRSHTQHWGESGYRPG